MRELTPVFESSMAVTINLTNGTTAIDNYSEFLHQFADAEPIFQPLVNEAERRLESALDASAREPGQAIPSTPSE